MSETYLELQTKLIAELRKLGLVYSQETRLPLFQLWTIVPNLGKQEDVNHALSYIQELLYMRTEGNEPDHEGDHYKSV
jgi:hypothetical protein